MKFFVGTSGYSYKEWKGPFYPAKFSDNKMLGYYADHFATVEINYSFRQIPTPKTIDSWAQQTPDSFRFVCKAPQAITHHKRLQAAEEMTQEFFAALAGLGKRQGPALFQLPPNFKKDLPRLNDFLGLVDGKLTAFEFRHESWFDEEVFACLREHSCALCVSDGEGFPDTELVSTSTWGYVRLRREEYSDSSLQSWLKKFQSLDCEEMYVFFKHEDAGAGPKLAARLLKLLGVETKPFGGQNDGLPLFSD